MMPASEAIVPLAMCQLPEDLLASLKEGGVTVTVQRLGSAGAASSPTSADAAPFHLHFATPTGTWVGKLCANNALDAVVVVQGGTGRSDSVEAGTSFTNVVTELHQQETSVGNAVTRREPSAADAEVIDDAERREMEVRIAHFMATGPREKKEVERHVAAWRQRVSRVAGSGRRAPLPAAVLEEMLAALTTGAPHGLLELNKEGYALIDIEEYTSKEHKQRIANAAMPKIVGDPDLIHRFSIYADRDVMLAALSRGGVMGGLGSARGGPKRQRESEDDSDDAEDGGGRVEAVGGSADADGQQGADRAPLELTEMSQSDVEWSAGDLTSVPRKLPEEVQAILAAREAHRQAQHPRHAAEPLPSMPITTKQELDHAVSVHQRLHDEFTAKRQVAEEHDKVAQRARVWSSANQGRIAVSLARAVESWFEAQREPRAELQTTLAALRGELDTLQREICDFVHLRAYSVFEQPVP